MYSSEMWVSCDIPALHQKSWKMTETMANGYSYESTQKELSNEYQHDKVSMVFKDVCVCVFWMKVALALEGLIWDDEWEVPYSHIS